MARKSAGNGSGAGGNTANLGFEAKLWLSADTATRVSANPECAATWRVLRAAQDHRSNRITLAAA